MKFTRLQPLFPILPERTGSMLQAKLKETGDEFHPKQHYLKEWSYEVESGGTAPYFKGKKPDNFKVQSPKNKPKAPAGGRTFKKVRSKLLSTAPHMWDRDGT